MPYRFEFDFANNIFHCHFEGRMGDHELKEYYRAIAEHAARVSPRATVADFSAIGVFDVSPDTIRELAKLPPAIPHPERPRVIVAPHPQIFGMARMFELLGEVTRPNLHVVRTHAEAWAILGIREPRFEPLPD
jgi:hypothetical protein